MFESCMRLLLRFLYLPLHLQRWFSSDQQEDDREHQLLKRHCLHAKFATSYATYPRLRIFYHPHAHADKLNSIADIPLFVFIHGIGGQLAQFIPILGSLISLAPCFGLELPGHGRSDLAPTEFEAYTFAALSELWKTAITDICNKYGHRKVVLIGHSLGCSFAATLASTTSPQCLNIEVSAVIGICPNATPPDASHVVSYRRILRLPNPVLDILRWFDRIGGTSSKSVRRFVGQSADESLKLQQLQFNRQFRTPAWKRIALGVLPEYSDDGQTHGGIPGREVWDGVCQPLFLIAGEADTVTKPTEVQTIVKWLKGTSFSLPLKERNDAESQPDAGDRAFDVRPEVSATTTKHSTIIKSAILPAPAAHALLYDHSSYRTVCGLIEDFLTRHVSPKLALGWQLQQLTTSGKWDVKNLEKWKRTLPVSGPIDDGAFRALKTLREQDEVHTPPVFLEHWRDKIFAIIDISHEQPIYDTTSLERGGIHYYKFPTVSKIPPTVVEVRDFIALVDRLNIDMKEEAVEGKGIGVHCHYGYNRTGFFIACYLVERRGYSLERALEEFAKHKPPGIKHDHFIDTLFVRYHSGLRRGSAIA